MLHSQCLRAPPSRVQAIFMSHRVLLLRNEWTRYRQRGSLNEKFIFKLSIFCGNQIVHRCSLVGFSMEVETRSLRSHIIRNATRTTNNRLLVERREQTEHTQTIPSFSSLSEAHTDTERTMAHHAIAGFQFRGYIYRRPHTKTYIGRCKCKCIVILIAHFRIPNKLNN